LTTHRIEKKEYYFNKKNILITIFDSFEIDIDTKQVFLRETVTFAF